jgi:hypothetical protein
MSTAASQEAWNQQFQIGHATHLTILESAVGLSIFETQGGFKRASGTSIFRISY